MATAIHSRPSLLCMLALALAAMAFSAALPAQDIVLKNPTGIPRKQWIDVAVPAADAANLPVLCRFDPQGWIAYRGSTVGQHSVMYHVLADLGAWGRRAGSLTPISNDPGTLPPWGMSDWIAASNTEEVVCVASRASTKVTRSSTGTGERWRIRHQMKPASATCTAVV